MIAKLRGRSVAELRDRLVQSVRAVVERRGFGLTPISVSGIVTTPVTPWQPPDGDAIQRRLPPEARAALLARADRITEDRFDLLGLEGVSYGSPVDWQLDPLSGRRAAMEHWSRVPYLDHDRVGDHKVTWEVNRHQWLITLGQAWQLTGDARYPAAAARLLGAWLDANPPKRGINWCSALELAFRVQSWIHGLRLLDSAAALPPELRTRLVSSAALQIDHVVKNLSTWFSPNTHLTGEALAMLAAGCAWPQLPDAARWRTEGWAILCREAPTQIRPDGVYFEQSAWYQSYTVDFYVLAVQWARLAGLPVPGDLPDRIRSAAVALRAVTRPDGTIVRLGDDDGGRTLPLTTAPFGDMTDSLWRAAHLLGDCGFLPAATPGRDALLWLEGPAAYDAMTARADAAPRTGAALKHGGWLTQIETAEVAGRDHWMVLDAGPHGALSHAHSHADALTIDLSVHGVPILIDAGTGAYVGPLRRQYRSTAAHNTVTVDDRDSSEQGTSFSWRTATDSVIDGFGTVGGASYMAAHHDGYRRLDDPVRHHRTILRLHRHYWLMFDTLDAQASHQASLTLQAAHGVRVEQRAPHLFAMSTAPSGAGVTLHVVTDPRLATSLETRTVSPAYGFEQQATALIARATVAAGATLCTVMGSADEGAPVAVEALADASTWRVTHRHGTDLVARPASGGVTLGPARFDGNALALLGGETPHTIVAAGTGTLHLAGRAYALAGDDVRLARRAPDGTWTMES